MNQRKKEKLKKAMCEGWFGNIYHLFAKGTEMMINDIPIHCPCCTFWRGVALGIVLSAFVFIGASQ